jgi:hypothetical protein
MTTFIPHTHIRQRDLSELVAGIPYVLGFPPTESLVLYTFRSCPNLALSTTIRVDLPKPDHVSLVVAELANAVAINEAVAVVAVAIGENADEQGELIEALRKMLADKDILLTHAAWVEKVAHGEQWQCYDDPLCTDIVPDPQSSALAAACAVAGDTTYPSREAIAAHLAPDPEEALARRRKLLDVHWKTPAQPYTDDDRDRDLEFLGLILDMTLTSYDLPTLTDYQLVRLAVALSQEPIKDECLAVVLSEERESAERLWTALVRALPAPERAEPAFFLAMSAYLRGAGILAARALGIVMESNPTHRTAVLLDMALRMGMPPDHLRSMLVTSIMKNDEEEADLDSEDDDDPPWDTSPEPETAADLATDAPERPAEPAPTGLASGGDLSSMDAVPSSTTITTDGAGNAVQSEATGGPSEVANPMRVAEPTRTSPGALSQRAAAVLGIQIEEPVRRTVVMDALTAFLPPPTDRIGPG